ncbi:MULTISPECIES: hypothetical protein [unclassified Streptomyces]|uniref:hypothetical protein n=1 Tax=unclassified Streptomyces TaxID=2593676 RepID=UPI003824B56C
MGEERELAGIRAWDHRPYDDRTDEELTRLIATGPVEALREERAGAAAKETEQALLAQIAVDRAHGESRGRREVAPVYPLLDRADGQLVIARTEQARETAAVKMATQADEHLRVLAAANARGRFALRLAGTSLKEHKQLTLQATGQRTAGWREAADARAAASRAAETAWEIVRSSPYATVLGTTEHQAPDVDTLAARLTEMRQTRVPARMQQIDTGDERRVSHTHGQAVRARENAAMYRAVAGEARTEEALRAWIAERHPALHGAETRARTEVRQVQEKPNPRIEAQRTPSHRPLPPGRSAPSWSR